MTTTIKLEALAKYLNIEQNEIVQSTYNENLFEYGSEEYLVLDDNEADEKAKESILDTVWAFNHSFLCAHSEAISEIPENDFKEMQGKLCESFNKAVLAMIYDKEHFVKDTILCDGRGRFLSQYDGEENEQKLGDKYFYIYRTN